MDLKMDNIILGSSPAARRVRHIVEQVADTDVAVLISGPTGAGKEFVARGLHHLSQRTGKLINVNCAAIPQELLESELFGYEKGAFTGAHRARVGRIEEAEHGTLFLDEIGDMPLSLQTKLLRVLENNRVTPLGGGEERRVDFRLVCATHQNMEQKVADGTFRADLYYRINVFPVSVPGLQERLDDLPAIVNHLLTIRKDRNKAKEPPQFIPSAMAALTSYHWPGNIRELRNVLERASVLFPGKPVGAREVRDMLLPQTAPVTQQNKEEIDFLEDALDSLADIQAETTNKQTNGHESLFSKPGGLNLRQHLANIEAELIEAALIAADGNHTQAAELLHIGRTTLIEKVRKYDINTNSPKAISA